MPLFYPRTFVDQDYAYLQLARCWVCAGVEPLGPTDPDRTFPQTR